MKTPLRLCLLTPLLLALFPGAGHSQLSVVAGAAHTQDFGGQWGADLRLGLDPPGLSIGIFGGADYFLPSCEESCGLRGYRLGAIFHSSTPGVQPYLTGGYVVREREFGGVSGKRTGLALGAGLRTMKAFRIQAEATWEFLGKGLSKWVVRIGLGL